MVLFLFFPGLLRAQVVQVPFSQCVYHLGDNPAWAAPNLNESDWTPYTQYRMTGDAYQLWLRCHTPIDTSAMRNPALAVGPNGPEQVQVFLDGRPAPASRVLPPFVPGIYPLSPDPARPTHTIAVRILQPFLVPGLTPGRPARVSLGDVHYLQGQQSALFLAVLQRFVPAYSCYLVVGAAGLFLLGLFLFDRSQKAAFWLGIYCCCVCLTRINVMLVNVQLPHFTLFINSVLWSLGLFETWALVRVNFALAGRRVPALYGIVLAAIIFMAIGSIAPPLLPGRWALPLSLFVQVACFKTIWSIWGFACTAPFVAFWPWTRLRGRLAIVAALCALWAVIEGWFQLQQVFLGRNTWSNAVQTWMSFAIAALVVALLGYIFREQRITADERAELRGELTAARQVQHLLVPDKMDVVPGVTIRAAFVPAREVGGDFYLCRALPNGIQRILLGDVSGKGVAAALTSALLLGAADRCDPLSPASVLKELNTALRNSSISGFTTCLCADLLPDGTLRIANAGQLPPYRNGGEIEIPPGLPLGIDPDVSYSESSLQLAPGDSLTFLSDGVVEARNAGGELFGFERTRQISNRPAQQIAEAALQFGQRDDITVLTLSVDPAPAIA
jgi:hypothetical protein